jgi:hypothetical protein
MKSEGKSQGKDKGRQIKVVENKRSIEKPSRK